MMIGTGDVGDVKCTFHPWADFSTGPPRDHTRYISNWNPHVLTIGFITNIWDAHYEYIIYIPSYIE